MANLVNPNLPSPTATVNADTISGTEFADILSGGDGNDFLFGEAGTDILIGGAGSDALVGGLDPNVFVFGPGNGVDQILDFEPGVDKISIMAGTGAIATAQDAVARVVADTDGTAVLNFDSANAVVLIGVAPSQLTVGDFSILPVG